VSEDFIWKVWCIEDEWLEIKERKKVLKNELFKVFRKTEPDRLVTERLELADSLLTLDDINSYISNFNEGGGNDMTKIKNIVIEAKNNRINIFVEKTCLAPSQVAENVVH